MTRIILFCVKTVLVLFVAFSLQSCNWVVETNLEGNGNTRTEVRNINGNFTKINASNAVEVIVEQANTTSIEVEADENILSHIKTKVENNTLYISCDGISSSNSLLVKVKMPHVEYIESTNASTIKSQNTLTGTNLKVVSDNASEVTIVAEYDAIDIEASGSASVEISGKTLDLNVKSSGAAEIGIYDLYANNVIAEADSASEIEVNPRVSLDAKASSAASIEYKGIAKSIKKSESSGGEVSKND